MTEILILYYSHHGSLKNMACAIAYGVESRSGGIAKIRTVPKVSAVCADVESDLPEHGPPYAQIDDLLTCDGIAMGSPTRFGNMAAPLKYFLDSTADIWLSGGLVGKPAGVFTSTASLHGGQESTLLSMMLPLLHHGMVIVGLPYQNPALLNTESGGTPYGPTHVAGQDEATQLADEEKSLCYTFGEHLVNYAAALKTGT